MKDNHLTIIIYDTREEGKRLEVLLSKLGFYSRHSKKVDLREYSSGAVYIGYWDNQNCVCFDHPKCFNLNEMDQIIDNFAHSTKVDEEWILKYVKGQRSPKRTSRSTSSGCWNTMLAKTA